MQFRMRAVARRTLLALAFASSATAQAQTCALVAGALPEPQHLEIGTLRYDKWNDQCLGDARVTWQEWKYQSNWAGGVAKLAMRFDYYVPTSVPYNRKLVIWAHPKEQTENLPTDKPMWANIAEPLLKAGYALMSIETRHVADSFVSAESIATAQDRDFPHPENETPDGVPFDDIAQAVQWAKQKADVLGIDGSNIVLVGQSRGSIALLNGLLNRPESKVKGVYVHQAQTTFREDQIKTTFIKANQPPERLYRSWFSEDFPNLPNGASSSAIDLAATAEVIPVHMGYEASRTLQANGNIKLQCYESHNANRAYDEPPTDDLPTCEDLLAGKPFDVHDPNYSEAFAQAYAPRAAGKFSRCFQLGKGRLDRAYGTDLVNFVDAATGGGAFSFTPACGGVAQNP